MGRINTVFRNLSYAMRYAYAVYYLCLCICAYVTQKARAYVQARMFLTSYVARCVCR